jgi:hypothetical protein
MSKEWHTVNGTLFGFPELPPREEIAPEVYAKWTAERTAILDKAAAVKYRKPSATRRGFKGPKPGDGVFEPKRAAPGFVLEVDGKRFEVWAESPPWGGVKAVWAVSDGRYYRVDKWGRYAEFDALGHQVGDVHSGDYAGKVA